eukprot:3415228-Pyramimonas_sp.AAC.2
MGTHIGKSTCGRCHREHIHGLQKRDRHYHDSDIKGRPYIDIGNQHVQCGGAKRRQVSITHTEAHVGQPWGELCDSIAKHHAKKYQNIGGIIHVEDDSLIPDRIVA